MRGRFHLIFVFALLLGAPADALGQPAPDCPVPADHNWTRQEQFAWKQICSDNVADFSTEPGNQMPNVLRKDFFESILTEEKYRKALKRHGLRITGARFTEKIDLQNIKVDVELWFDQCRFDSDRGIDLSWLQASQPVGFTRSKAAGPLNFYSAQLASDLIIQDSDISTISLSGTHIGRTLDLSKSRASGMLDMPGVDIGVDLLMSEGNYNGAVNLIGAHVGHTLDIKQAKVAGELTMTNLQVGTDVRMSKTNFEAAIDLQYSQIGGEVDWSGARFQDDVDLTRARVGGAFLLNADDNNDPATWAPQVTLTARYAKFAVIPSWSAAWPRKLDVVGLSYDGIDGVDGDFHRWFRRQDYSRQPYEQLAGVLQNEGEIELATSVRFAERDRDRWRSYSDRNVGVAIWLTMLWAVIGYGYYPYVALIWVIFFVVLGAFILRRSGEGPRNGMPHGYSYSFDMLLPIIQLRPSHYDIDLKGRARYYFYVHKIIGWALASFLVAGLSGLTK